MHFKNTAKFYKQAGVKERTTKDVTDDNRIITLDRYDNGNKIETFEYYYGKRVLSKFNGSAWKDMHDTTHYGFSYDANGNQTHQLNYNYIQTEEHHMYRYNKFGEIERWETGRSFQLPHILECVYDNHGTVIKETSCWTDSCLSNSINKKNFRSTLEHHVKYNKHGLLTEDLVNYMDGMSGYLYTYQFDKSGRVILREETSVWSYFGLDHDIPTVNDIDRKKLNRTWKYEYNSKGELVKETRTEEWMEVPGVYIMKYNSMGLIIEELADDINIYKYTYDEKGLVKEKYHYMNNDEKTLFKKYIFEYTF